MPQKFAKAGGAFLKLASPAEVAQLRMKYPSSPEEYLVFLQEIGSGNFGIWPVLLIGDDYQGYCFGFDVGNGFRMVEGDPRGNVRTIEPRFETLIRRLLSETV